MHDAEPTTDQREAAKDVLRQLLSLCREEGVRRAVFPEGSETYKILVRGGYKFWLSPVPYRRGMYRISKREIVKALKFW